MASIEATPERRLARSEFSIWWVHHGLSRPGFWRTRRPEDRIRALCYLRWLEYGDAAAAPMQRVLTLARLDDA
jgi:hypothetical protein